MSTGTRWKPASSVLDPETVRSHLEQHGVFDAADEFYERVERGQALDGVMTPDEVRAWLRSRCA